MGRQPRCARLRGDGGAAPHPDALPARGVPAAVRPARRLVEHRREHLGGHDLLGAALPEERRRQLLRRERAGVPAAGAQAGRRRVRGIRADHGLRAHGRRRGVRLHARPRDLHLRPDASRRSASPRTRRNSPSTPRTRGAGSRRSSATSTSASPGRTARAARTSTCAGSPRWWPTCSACSRAAGSSCTRATRRTRKAACASCTRRTRCRSSSSRRAAPPPTGDIPILDLQPKGLHQRCAVILGSKNEVDRVTRTTRNRKGPPRGPLLVPSSSGNLISGGG